MFVIKSNNLQIISRNCIQQMQNINFKWSIVQYASVKTQLFYYSSHFILHENNSSNEGSEFVIGTMK